MFTLSFTLDQDSRVKLYYQLYNKLAHEIECGNIQEGTKIFSVRDMAGALGVSRNTVTKAYSELINDGYLVSRNKSGFYACNPKSLKSLSNKKTSDIKSSCESLEQNLIESYKFALTLNVQLLKSSGDPFGDINFRISLCNFIKRFRDLDVSPNQMIVSAGYDLLFMNLLHMDTFTRPYSKSTGLLAAAAKINHDKIIKPLALIPEDSSESLKKVLNDSSVDYDYIKFTDGLIDMDALYHSNATILFVSPKDVILKDEEELKDCRKKVLDWAGEESFRYIIEIDNLSYKDKRKTFKSEDKNDKVIYVSSISGLLFKAINACWMILPQCINSEYRKKYVDFECVFSRLDQLALTDFINGGNLLKHLNDIEEL